MVNVLKQGQKVPKRLYSQKWGRNGIRLSPIILLYPLIEEHKRGQCTSNLAYISRIRSYINKNSHINNNNLPNNDDFERRISF